jgi:hypothetical protein
MRIATRAMTLGPCVPFAVVLRSGDLDAALDGEVESLVRLQHEPFGSSAEGVMVVAALRAEPDDRTSTT